MQLLSINETLYIQIKSEQISMHVVNSKITHREAAIGAYKLSSNSIGEVIEIGSTALKHQQRSEVAIIKPFEHPRLLVGGFVLIEQFLKKMTNKILPPNYRRIGLSIVMHPMEKLEGGITQIEARALGELAWDLGANRNKTYVWTGRELSSSDLLSMPLDSENLITW